MLVKDYKLFNKLNIDNSNYELTVVVHYFEYRFIFYDIFYLLSKSSFLEYNEKAKKIDRNETHHIFVYKNK